MHESDTEMGARVLSDLIQEEKDELLRQIETEVIREELAACDRLLARLAPPNLVSPEKEKRTEKE
jgi:hypothetical protein